MSILETAKPQTVSTVQNSYSFLQLLFYVKLKTGRLKTAQQIRIKKIFFSGIVFLFKTGNLAAGTKLNKQIRKTVLVLAENRKPQSIRKPNRETLNRKRHKADPTNGQIRKTEISTALIRCS